MLFEKEFLVKESCDLEKVWKLYEDVSKWPIWDKSLKAVELNGNFETNTKGVLFLSNDGAPPLKFTLEKVIPKKRFLSVSILNNIKISIDHIIENKNNIAISIKHIISVEGENENIVQGIGTNLTKNLEESMKNIIRLSQD